MYGLFKNVLHSEIAFLHKAEYMSKKIKHWEPKPYPSAMPLWAVYGRGGHTTAHKTHAALWYTKYGSQK